MSAVGTLAPAITNSRASTAGNTKSGLRTSVFVAATRPVRISSVRVRTVDRPTASELTKSSHMGKVLEGRSKLTAIALVYCL